ncbi:hypothetical protein FQB35_10565 [Crassaminicella thermophila]|uniref:Uncharacterized protein n=1 Tax=Crassaminicella thermophila TaxID=2599308 RepID=A0A5C0SIG1_CRATE|nr:hypothetical protein [Crassaminicella thermophila]QEK12599.1 hypothetical protein FQB35_09815 [Crassaminicella thermophila]QEK12739.1 hypothetical protein FQB35_10565 [Crassaminicella thermophila]
MGYEVGYTSSTESGKCIICGKVSGIYLTINQHQELKTKYNKINSSILIPVCLEHYNVVAEQKEILIYHLEVINKFLKSLK